MATVTRNAYLRYKEDTSQLVYWVTQTHHGIFHLSKAKAANDPGYKAVLEPVNTTKVSVSTLKQLCLVISQHINEVPTAIFRLFRAVIDARTACYNVFQQIVAEKPDEAIEESNRRHKHFIDTLVEGFHMLGGKDWQPEKATSTPEVRADASNGKETIDQLLLSNRFDALDLGRTASDDEETEHSADDVSLPPLNEALPLKSYGITHDTDEPDTDYLMAVYALAQEWVDLRSYLQKVWRQSAYDNLNTAVAGGLSNLAAAMIQRSEVEIFLDFPKQDAFNTIIKTITGHDIDKHQGQVRMALPNLAPEVMTETSSTTPSPVDAKEQLMVHAYHDLVEFIEDFQQNRSGKPSEQFLKESRKWDPEFSLQKASSKKRIRWRRVYTINWLYDMVNLYSSTVMQEKLKEGEVQVLKLEKEDWLRSGRCGKVRRLFGLEEFNEFAGFVTSLAMQPPGTNIRERILPHHVFQVQCIVDSLMVSRGWSISPSGGHMLESPPPPTFRPRRDLDHFLGRKGQKAGHGFLPAAQRLRRHPLYDDVYYIAGCLRDEFGRWLGQSDYYASSSVSRNNPTSNRNIPSCFSHANPNGLWDYSPFLCGVGLVEALDLAFLAGMQVWERLPETMMLVHLHSMLVKKGYLENPVDLFASLETQFTQAFFSNEGAPSEMFADACRGKLETPRRWRPAGQDAGEEHDLRRQMALEYNSWFKGKSSLVLCRQSNWNIDAIPDADIPVNSPLLAIRGSPSDRSNKNKNQNPSSPPRTGCELLEVAKTDLSNDITGRLEARPLSNINYVSIAAYMLDLVKRMEEQLRNRRNRLYVNIYESNLSFNLPLFVRRLVEEWYIKKMDLDKLHGLEKQVVKSYYERDKKDCEKRMNLLYKVMRGVDEGREDEECLRIMADLFDERRTNFASYLYWGGEEDGLLEEDAESEHTMESDEELVHAMSLPGRQPCSVQ